MLNSQKAPFFLQKGKLNDISKALNSNFGNGRNKWVSKRRLFQPCQKPAVLKNTACHVAGLVYVTPRQLSAGCGRDKACWSVWASDNWTRSPGVVWVTDVLLTELGEDIFTKVKWKVLCYLRGEKGTKPTAWNHLSVYHKEEWQPAQKYNIHLSLFLCSTDACHSAANVRLHAGCRCTQFWQLSGSKVRYFGSYQSCLRPHSFCDHTWADHRTHQAPVRICCFFFFLPKDVCALLVTTAQNTSLVCKSLPSHQSKLFKDFLPCCATTGR